VEQAPEHEICTRAVPMSSPQIPPTTMVTKATALALTVGRAVGPRSGNRNGSSGCGTRRS
jgi:hypothetical protein